jgi:hypothetical protein
LNDEINLDRPDWLWLVAEPHEHELRAKQLARWLEPFEIGEPVKTWLQPQIELDFSVPTNARLKIRFHSIDTDVGTGEKKLLFFDQALPIWINTEKAMQDFLLECLIMLVSHEVRESIRVNGVKAYDPHAGLFVPDDPSKEDVR